MYNKKLKSIKQMANTFLAKEKLSGTKRNGENKLSKIQHIKPFNQIIIEKYVS